MRRLILPLLAIAVAVGFAALIIFGVANTAEDRSIDEAVASGKLPAAPAATTELPVIGSKGTTSLAKLRGKVVVLNIWASWCPPCRDEAPVLEKTWRRIAPAGATVLGVTWNDTETDSLAFIRKAGLTYPQARDVGGSFAKAYGTKGLPETFVIDRQGRITAARRGEVDADFLDAALEPLLGPGSVR